MVTLAVASLLAMISFPAYTTFVNRAKVAAGIGDISRISLSVEQFRLNNENKMPASLAEIAMVVPLDPWGRPYQFLDAQAAGPGKGALRKDGKLNPLNTDFDLYSMGKDGGSKLPLSAEVSRDDIVRASNGAYFGLASKF